MDPGALAEPLSAEDHIDGLERAELVLVMYGGFECPYCAAAFPIVSRVRQTLGDRLLFAFRHFPLRDVHPNAQAAAEAAEAAASQGAFWPMHDRLYESGGRLTRRDLLGYANELGLDQGQVEADLDSGAHAARVERDLQSGRASGTSSTPAFFVGGKLHSGAFDAGSLIAALEASKPR